MNAQDLREWLLTATGKQLETDNFLGQFMVGGVPGNGTAANSSTGQFFPCLVRRTVKPNGFGYYLKITGCLQGGADALNVLFPAGDPLYAQFRPNLKLDPATAKPVAEDARLFWHPSLGGVSQLYDEGKVSLLPSVG